MRFTHTVLLNSLFEEKNKKAREEKDNRKGSKEVESDLVNVLECSSKSERFYTIFLYARMVRYGT